MRSFAGRDILSLKDFEREEFDHVFQVAEELEPIARHRRNTGHAQRKNHGNGFLSAKHPHPPGSRSCHAPPGWTCDRFLGCQNDPGRRLVSGIH